MARNVAWNMSLRFNKDSIPHLFVLVGVWMSFLVNIETEQHKYTCSIEAVLHLSNFSKKFMPSFFEVMFL